MDTAVQLALVTVARVSEGLVTHVTRDTGLVTRHVLPDPHNAGIQDGQPALAALHHSVVVWNAVVWKVIVWKVIV